MNKQSLSLVILFIVSILVSGFSGFYVGELDKTPSDNHPPEIRDMWVSHYPYAMKDRVNSSTEMYPYLYPYAYNVDVRDYDGDFLNVKFYVKHGNIWIMEQEQFGKDGLYTFYPYVYEYPTPMAYGYAYTIAKIVITDNVNTVSREF